MPTKDPKKVFTAPATYMLRHAVRINSQFLFNLSIALKADVHIQDKGGNSLLHLARSKKIAQGLIDHGVQINAQNKSGYTPLVCALIQAREEDRDDFAQLINYLLQQGADPNLCIPERVPLHIALQKDRIIPLKLVAELIEHGANLNMKNHKGLTPLTYAIQRSLVRAAVLLISNGAQTTNDDPLNPNIYHTVYNNWRKLCIEPGYESLLDVVFHKHINPEANPATNNFDPLQAYQKHNPIHFAAFFCTEAALAPFSNLGKNYISEKDHHGLTPLHWAVINGNLRAATALLKANARVDVCDERGMPPMYYAANHPRCPDALMELLIEHGSNVNRRMKATHADVTLLHAAARQPDAAQAIKKLIEYGANPNAKDGIYMTDHTSLVPNEYHADPFITNAGRTPLHYAAGVPDNITALIRGGATIEGDNLGFNPEIYAEKLECRQSVAVLQGVPKVNTWTNSLQLSMRQALGIAASLAKNTTNGTIFAHSPKQSM